MASARKDKKGRALYKGENEHAAGGYYYQYMHHGKRRIKCQDLMYKKYYIKMYN